MFVSDQNIEIVVTWSDESEANAETTTSQTSAPSFKTANFPADEGQHFVQATFSPIQQDQATTHKRSPTY